MNAKETAPTVSMVRGLLLPKFLLLEAQDYLRRPEEYSPGLATSLLQDAVEAFLRFLAVDGQIEVSEKASFVELLNKVGAKHRKILDHRAAMTNLNKARVNFKHASQMVLLNDALGFQSNVNHFLNEIARDVLGVDFAAISLVDAIGHKQTEELLHNADKAIIAEEFQTAIFLSAEAAARYLKYRARRPGSSEKLLGRIPIGANVLHLQGLDDAMFSSQTEELGRWTAGAMQRTQALLLLLARGVDVASFYRFQEIAPPISLPLRGPARTVWFSYKKQQVSKANAKFCVRFVIELALQLRRTAIAYPPEAEAASAQAKDGG
ncbi:MAG: hypothetical protein OXK81_14175 [Chloroflexota bacterium]|nr:hypothetical protein [Chloroflexota bacterium]